MSTHVQSDFTKQHDVAQRQSLLINEPQVMTADNRTEVTVQRQLQNIMNKSPHVAQAKAQQAMMNMPIQRMNVTPKRSTAVKNVWGDGADEDNVNQLIAWAKSDKDLKELLEFVTADNIELLLELDPKKTTIKNAKAYISKEGADVEAKPATPDFAAPSAGDLWDSVQEAVTNALPGVDIRRVSRAEKRSMSALQLEIERLTHFINYDDNAKARRTERNLKSAELEAEIVALGARLQHEDAERAKDATFVTHKTALAARPAVQANAHVAAAVAQIQRLGATNTISLPGIYSAAELRAACTIWNTLADEGNITNFFIPGGANHIKAKPRGGFIDVNKVLACKVNNVDVFIHLTADAALTARATAAGVDTDISL